MRTWISLIENAGTLERVVETLFESPGIAATSFNFGMENPGEEERRAQIVLNAANKRLLRDNEHYWIYDLPTTGDKGQIVLIDKGDEKIKYFVIYKAVEYPLVGSGGCQVALWRKLGYVPGRGVWEDIFLEILLRRFGIMYTDDQQSRDGQRFWLNVLAKAAWLGLRVGMIDIRDSTVVEFDGNGDIVDWAEETMKGWGDDHEYPTYKIFFISRAGKTLTIADRA